MSLLKSIERYGRKRVRKLLRAILAAGADNGELPIAPTKLLVARTDIRLGNLVLMEPLLSSLRRRFPECEIHVLAGHVFAGLIESQGYIVRTVDKKGQIAKPWKLLKLRDDLRSTGYDAVLDASHPHSFSLSTAVTCFLSGAPCRIGFDSGEGERWYTHAEGEPARGIHESKAIHALGNLWSDWPEWTPPRLITESLEKRDAVGIHVGASGRKVFPTEYFEKIIEKASTKTSVEVYWGTPEEKKIADTLRSAHGVKVMPKLIIEELLRSMTGLRAFLSPDNGPMHVASALGIPVVGLFRVDNSDRFRPLSPGSAVIFDPEAKKQEMAVEMLLEAYGLSK